MRLLLVIASILLMTACAQIQTVAHKTERLPPGSAVTLHMVGIEGAGLEHELTRVLTEAGFDVRSQAALSMVISRNEAAPGKAERDSSERVMRYETPYVCRIKAMGYGSTITSFTLQVIHVPTGRILLSQAGGNGNWSAPEVARTLQTQLK